MRRYVILILLAVAWVLGALSLGLLPKGAARDLGTVFLILFWMVIGVYLIFLPRKGVETERRILDRLFPSGAVSKHAIPMLGATKSSVVLFVRIGLVLFLLVGLFAVVWTLKLMITGTGF